MSRCEIPKTLQIGPILVVTENIHIARQAATLVKATPELNRQIEGVVLIDGMPVKWRWIKSPPNQNPESFNSV